MKWESGDLKVGLVVLLTLVLLVGGVLWLTPTVTDRSVSLYTEYDRIDGLATQAPVQLGGYQIGRVDAITPHLDAGGSLRFRVRMKIDWRPDSSGDRLPVPLGTRARLVPPPVAGTAFLVGYVMLEPPAARGMPPVRPNDTLPGVRATAALEQIQGVAMDLTRGWSETLVAVRALTDSLTRTAHYTNRLTTSVDTMLPRLVVSLHERLATADTLMRELRAVAPTAVASMDSAQAMIADSRRLMADVDRTLAARDPQMGRVLANLDTTTALLNHFVREVTRRPGRLVSGVTPPDRLDPARAAERRRRACGRGPCTATTDSVTAPAADSSGTK